MTPERYERVHRTFEAARAKPPPERPAFLEAECAGDDELRREVESLLAHDVLAASAMPTVGMGPIVRETVRHLPEAELRQVGPYQLVSVLGEGGFGIVYLADQAEPVRRRVALKIIKPGMDSRAVLARFEQERQALALMDHPNVARVYDAGTTPEGRPYFVMEHVPGVPITDYCDRHTLTTRARLELFVGVCEAIQHAHTKGIIHRDVKPSNILVTLQGARPVPKVIDFGVAKAIARPLTDRTLFTEQGQFIGTPEYMSPEQAGTTGLDVDARTDVYSLGVVLYELLSGALPFEPRELREKGLAEIQRIIREVDPPRPSTRLTSRSGPEAAGAGSEIAHHRRTSLHALSRELRRELEWIPLKAMRKDRAHRYRTAQELADDVLNYLAGKPLIAGPESAPYRVRKFVRRHRVGVGAAGAILLAVAGGAVATSLGLFRAVRAERIAQAERDVALATAEFVDGMLRGVDPRARGGRIDVTVREMLDAAGAVPEGGPDRASLRVESAVRRLIGDTNLAIGRRVEASRHLQRAIELERALDPAGGGLGAALRSYAEFQLASVELEAANAITLDAAEASASEALAILDRCHPGDDAEKARALNTCALIAHRQGRVDAAQPLYERALAMRQRLWPRGHIEVVQALYNLAILHDDRADYANAERRLTELIPIADRVQGPDFAYTTMARASLAACLRKQGRAAEAEPLIIRALARNRELLGDQHPDIALDLRFLATIELDLGRRGEAADHLLEAIAIDEGASGAESIPVAESTHLLGIIRRDEANYPEARTLLLRAAEIYSAHPGTEGRRAETLSDLAWTQFYLGMKDAAIASAREAAALRRAGSSAPVPEYARTLRDLGYFLFDSTRHAEARPVLEESLTVYRACPPSAHLEADRAVALSFLGMCLLELNQPALAEPHLRECLDIRLREPGIARWRLGVTRSALGAAIARQGRHAEAEPLLLAAYDELVGVPEAPTGYLDATVDRLAELYGAWDRPLEAESWRARRPARP